MGNEAPSLEQEPIKIEQLDETFLHIIEGLGKQAISGAADCTDAVFRLSSNYIDRPAFTALKKFYDLYFGDQQIEGDKDSVNQEVDQMVANMQGQLAAGEDIDGVEVEEDELLKRRRLGLAGVQKQLEGLITLNTGIKEQVLPALTSMQFEDAVSQRVDHIVQGWRLIDHALYESNDIKTDDLAKALADICSSVEETKDFYRMVLDEEPPEGQEERSIFLEF